MTAPSVGRSPLWAQRLLNSAGRAPGAASHNARCPETNAVRFSLVIAIFPLLTSHGSLSGWRRSLSHGDLPSSQCPARRVPKGTQELPGLRHDTARPGIPAGIRVRRCPQRSRELRWLRRERLAVRRACCRRRARLQRDTERRLGDVHRRGMRHR